jgi:hypothetical protein
MDKIIRLAKKLRSVFEIDINTDGGRCILKVELHRPLDTFDVFGENYKTCEKKMIRLLRNAIKGSKERYAGDKWTG